MEKKDETIELLKEIRDLEQQEVSLLKEEKFLKDKEQNSTSARLVLKIIYNVVIVGFVIGAFWYFYHTLYGTGLATM